ncbi:tryptophan--tRNA ligase, mitochondrial-like isoform X3 [Tachypleus tridentatus]|uniref:tryptophan--tRNA ligase, mitochondrial-like isoform X3 n=1 Tax=Tachypleus tridentatus TaxID=6853 RepID=UPI003FCFDB26
MLNSRCKFITFGRNGIHKMLKRCMTLSRYRTSKAINDQYVAKSIESKNKCSLGESTGNKKNNNQFSQRIVFSGIQPTGPLHLGNYFGAIKKWETLQYLNIPCIYSIVDLHSITLPQNPQRLRTNIQVVTACLLASGIDPDKSILFLQSQVPQHTELAWILGCSLTMARLGQLPQFKEKSSSLKEIPLGLYIYPVLQSADILLYKATEVPVGEDQFPHIQLAQHLARSFNNKFGYLFPHPKPSIRRRDSSQPFKKV